MAEENKYEQVDLTTTEGFKLSDISEMGAQVEPGKYKMRLVRIEGRPSKTSSTPMVVAAFDILDGSNPNMIGLEATAFYSMWVGRNEKNGKVRIIAPGIMEIKAALAAVGKALPDDFIFPSDVRAAAKIVHDGLNPKAVGDLEGVVIHEQDRKDKTITRTKVRIIGRYGAQGEIHVAGATSPQQATGGEYV